MHCRRFVEPGMNRRDMLLRSGGGFGALALASLLRLPAFGAVVGDVPAETVRDLCSVPLKPTGCLSLLHFRGEGPERHLLVHGRRAIADGYV